MLAITWNQLPKQIREDCNHTDEIYRRWLLFPYILCLFAIHNTYHTKKILINKINKVHNFSLSVCSGIQSLMVIWNMVPGFNSVWIYLAASLRRLDSEDDGHAGARKNSQLCDYSCYKVRWCHVICEVQWRQTTYALPLWQRVFLHIKICWNELIRVTCPKENACHLMCPCVCFI